MLKAGPEDNTVNPTVEPAPRRPFWARYGRALAAAIAVMGLVITAIAFYQWGSAEPPPERAGARPSPSPSRTGPLTVNEVFNTLAPSVVAIKATGAGTATGTGVVVNAEAAILTAYHVVEGATDIEVAFADGTTAKAELAGADPSMDIAVLEPETPPSVIVPAVLGGAPNIGDAIVAIGNQLGLNHSTTSGVVSGLDRTLSRGEDGELKGLIQFDAAVNPGSSGGPLVNMRGETVGIVVALANPTEDGTFIGVGFAVPIGAAVAAGGERPPQI
ncbi:MAG TPA: trypsin-like peptidase domain-containing protein [Candidatus Limnocylindrales bacterium]